MDKKLLEKPENYYNREMSWLQFNYRILNEAKDKSIPLFERLNFLSITESNLSEFFIGQRHVALAQKSLLVVNGGLREGLDLLFCHAIFSQRLLVEQLVENFVKLVINNCLITA